MKRHVVAILLVPGLFAGIACGSSENANSPVSDGGTPPGSGGAGADASAGETGGNGGSVGSDGGGNAGAPDAGTDAGLGPCTLSDTWTIADDYVHDPTGNSNPSQLAVTADQILASGFSIKSGVATGLLRASPNGTDFTLVKAQAGIGGDLAAAADGTLFVAGGSADGKTRSVLRSTDAGKTWDPVDTVPLDTGACNTGYVAVTSTGTVYSAGSCDAEGWHVRVSKDNGDTWEDVGANYQLTAGMPARLADLLVDSEDHVYLSGTAQDAQQVAHWVVRQLASTGFATVDDFVFESGKSATNPTLSGTTRVYVTGSAEGADGKHWLVRRADPTGVTWTTLDSYVPVDATAAAASSVIETADKALIAVGTVSDAQGVQRVVTRTSRNDGQSWTGSDGYGYAIGKSSFAVGDLVRDARGNVYSSVRGVAADDHAHWLVRRLACK